MSINEKELTRRFSYHPPNERKKEHHANIRAELQGAAVFICQVTPAGREQSLAVTRLEEAMFWANAALAREEQ